MKSSLTVVIPNYNKAKYIGRCLDSILQQTYLPEEIIVVDDCSTDDSREIINEYAEKHGIIRTIYLEENAGVSNARNTGIKSVKTEFLTFIDSDDYYFDRNKLKNEMAKSLEYSALGYEPLVYSRTIIVDEEGNLISCRQNKKWKKYEFIKGPKALSVLISRLKQKRIPRDYCIRKNIIEKVGAYSFPNNFYEDLDLLMRIARSGVYFVPTYMPGTAYRQVTNGLSSKSSTDHKVAMDEICDSYIKDLSVLSKLKVFCLKFYVKARYSAIKVLRKLLHKA